MTRNQAEEEKQVTKQEEEKKMLAIKQQQQENQPNLMGTGHQRRGPETKACCRIANVTQGGQASMRNLH
jgi:hypothetical protein